MKNAYEPIPLNFERLTPDLMAQRAEAFYASLKRRRTVRDFSDEPVPDAVVRNAILTAGTAPSGANQQPWHFVVITDPALKRRIRLAAEEEERAFYQQRASEEWLDALAPLGTDAEKPFLETASHLIVIFLKKFSYDAEGQKQKNYYTSESVGIATGFLISALHQASVATLTHTPSPMKFLNKLLDRPTDERPYMILVAGYPAANCHVPTIEKKPLAEIATFIQTGD
ncbi:nitroreductase family protein [Reinekea blandensis]|uniref:Nitroreductase family protein n=1 Tax=Reinekea blandensis MED297 TaxID=314283 RepID=A4BG20_9GAMM|nr:nitroreductase family protein [Reinekea blandensis]EAR09038.1 nitroreductase family protein [Reinekea sp. MED297] [Reinekea blandensis MED297]